MGFWEPLFFWIFAIGALAASLAVIVLRNPLYCALSLIVDFFFFAGLYALLSAHFIAIIQILVYGGAIMVLFLFIIMLLNLRDSELGESRFSLHQVVAAVAAVGLFLFSGVAILAITDDGAVSKGRELAAEQQAQSAEPIEVAIQTPSAIPGLYSDINEYGVHETYRNQLQSLGAGESRPWDDKYRPYDSSLTVTVPPGLVVDANLGSPSQQGQNLFGSFLPISILLVNRFVIAFELTAVLLLAAIVGAVIMAKRRITN